MRRTGLRPRSVESLVMAGAFDRIAPNRRQWLWDAGLYTESREERPGHAAALDGALGPEPSLADFSEEERMAGEYRTMGIYPQWAPHAVRQTASGF